MTDSPAPSYATDLVNGPAVSSPESIALVAPRHADDEDAPRVVVLVHQHHHYHLPSTPPPSCRCATKLTLASHVPAPTTLPRRLLHRLRAPFARASDAGLVDCALVLLIVGCWSLTLLCLVQRVSERRASLQKVGEDGLVTIWTREGDEKVEGQDGNCVPCWAVQGVVDWVAQGVDNVAAYIDPRRTSRDEEEMEMYAYYAKGDEWEDRAYVDDAAAWWEGREEEGEGEREERTDEEQEERQWKIESGAVTEEVQLEESDQIIVQRPKRLYAAKLSNQLSRSKT